MAPREMNQNFWHILDSRAQLSTKRLLQILYKSTVYLSIYLFIFTFTFYQFTGFDEKYFIFLVIEMIEYTLFREHYIIIIITAHILIAFYIFIYLSFYPAIYLCIYLLFNLSIHPFYIHTYMSILTYLILFNLIHTFSSLLNIILKSVTPDRN